MDKEKVSQNIVLMEPCTLCNNGTIRYKKNPHYGVTPGNIPLLGDCSSCKKHFEKRRPKKAEKGREKKEKFLMHSTFCYDCFHTQYERIPSYKCKRCQSTNVNCSEERKKQ
jgi:hypothetical protein